jgi:hypothetical protein
VYKTWLVDDYVAVDRDVPLGKDGSRGEKFRIRIAKKLEIARVSVFHVGHGCACCGADDDIGARTGDITAALSSATQELQRVTMDINDTLEELRYVLAEL